jgi:hypothetical protein
MNFGKLLAVGRSIVNSRAEVSYRADKQFTLPKFGPGKNPFTKAPVETVPAPAPTEQPAAQKAPSIPAPPPRFASPPSPAPVLRPAPSAANGMPVVQPELSLDTVKVVNNDLSDADVEVVPLKSRGGVAELPPARKSWEILGERLLKATAL